MTYQTNLPNCPSCKRKPKNGYMVPWGAVPNQWHHRAIDCRAVFYWINGELVSEATVESIGAAVLDAMPNATPDTVVAVIRDGLAVRILEEVAKEVEMYFDSDHPAGVTTGPYWQVDGGRVYETIAEAAKDIDVSIDQL